MVKVELTHLLAYNMSNLTHINVDYCGCAFLTAEELWRDALDYEFVNEQLLEDLKIADFYLHRCKVHDHLGLYSEWSAQTPVPWGFVTAYRGVKPLFFQRPISTRRVAHRKCFHRNCPLPVSLLWLNVEPTGRRCFSSHWTCTRSFHRSLQTFQSVLVHHGVFKPVLLIATWELVMRCLKSLED